MKIRIGFFMAALAFMFFIYVTCLAQAQDFVEQTGISLPGLQGGSAVWGDYDNDGDLDILLTGASTSSLSSGISKIYRNNGDGTFTEQTSISLPGVSVSSAAWGDYDNDGDLDILLTGWALINYGSYIGGEAVSRVYKNNGNNTFTGQTNISLTGVYLGSSAWGDYDNDGDLDILLTGAVNTSRIAKIYKNNGDNTFTEQLDISLTGVYSSSVAWGDCDNNGYLDILLTGYSNSGGASRIYRNNVSSASIEETKLLLHCDGVDGATVFVDETGKTITAHGNAQIDTAQSKFGGASALFDGTGDYISTPDSNDWAFGTDDFTIDFWIRWDSLAGYPVLFSKVVDDNNKFWIYKDGNMRFLWKSAGQIKAYYGFSYNFSPGVWYHLAFVRQGPDLKMYLNGVSQAATVYAAIGNNSLPQISTDLKIGTGIDLGVDDFNGWIDELKISKGIAQWTENFIPSNTAYIYSAVGQSGVFYEEPNIPLPPVWFSSVAWGDYDNDGDLDILLTGATNNLQKVSKIYKNNGDGTFTEQTNISLPGIQWGSTAWGDYDNDGYLDILLTGATGTYPNYVGIAKIYRNSGYNTFTEQTDISLAGISHSSAAWGDYDNDGDLDILLTGESGSGGYVSKVYKNTLVEDGGAGNIPPGAPTNLEAIINGGDVNLSWLSSTDSETSENGLSYNLMAGISPNGIDKLSPMSLVAVGTNCAAGQRKIATAFGAQCQNTSWTLKNLMPGYQYFVRVQAIDSGFKGSAFSDTVQFFVGTPVVGGLFGSVWMDDGAGNSANANNGQMDSSEEGIGGQTVHIEGVDVTYSADVVTDSSGQFYAQLEPGTYTVSHQLIFSQALTHSYPVVGLLAQQNVTVTAGNNTSNVDFGIIPVAAVTQQINLSAGWNMISLNVVPLDASTASVFGDILSNVILVKDGDGKLYWPAYGVDQINNISTLKGYQIKVINACTLSVTGIPVGYPVNIPLVSGWQIIGYPVADGDIRNVADVFAPLVDPNGDGDFADSKIIIVKNGPGQVYWPQFGVNTIGNMVPGQGYQVRMSESDTLTFNEPSNQNGQN